MMISCRLSVLLLSVALCAGCSIEKRVHRGGYYIQWHKRHGHAAGHKQQQEKEPAVAAEETVEAPEDTLVPPEVAETPAADTAADPVKHPDREADTLKRDRKFEPVGVLSAKLLAVPVVLALLDDQAGTHQQSFWLSLAFVLLLCLCLFLGTVSMIRYLRNPKAYKFNIWAILAILVPLALFVVVLADIGDVF